MENLTEHVIYNRGIGSCLCTFYNNGKAKVMLIDNVKVGKKYRNSGIGTYVMNKALDLARAKDVDVIELVVRSNNKIAKKLYEKVGFEKTNKEHYRRIIKELK